MCAKPSELSFAGRDRPTTPSSVQENTAYGVHGTATIYTYTHIRISGSKIRLAAQSRPGCTLRCLLSIPILLWLARDISCFVIAFISPVVVPPKLFSTAVKCRVDVTQEPEPGQTQKVKSRSAICLILTPAARGFSVSSGDN